MKATRGAIRKSRHRVALWTRFLAATLTKIYSAYELARLCVRYSCDELFWN